MEFFLVARWRHGSLIQYEIKPNALTQPWLSEVNNGKLMLKIGNLTKNRHATWYGLSVSNTDFGLFWNDTAVSPCDTDLEQITEKQFMNMCSETKHFLSSTQLALSGKFPKNVRFRLRWSTIDLVNQKRMPNPTVAPRDVKLRFWFFAAGCRFLLHNVSIFGKTASRYELAWTFSRYNHA